MPGIAGCGAGVLFVPAGKAADADSLRPETRRGIRMAQIFPDRLTAFVSGSGNRVGERNPGRNETAAREVEVAQVGECALRVGVAVWQDNGGVGLRVEAVVCGERVRIKGDGPHSGPVQRGDNRLRRTHFARPVSGEAFFNEHGNAGRGRSRRVRLRRNSEDR